jgi:predicted ATPase
MKLDKLWLKDFKNLKDVEIDFDQDQLITVVIGWNGAGKSNLIEALVIIFRDLDLGNDPMFAYRLEYLCRGRRIVVTADPDKPKKDRYHIQYTEDNTKDLLGEDKWTKITFNNFYKDEERQYMPSNVFGYYSGPSNRLEQYFEKHQEKFYRALLKGDSQPLRPLFYARLIHSQFVLLSFFLGKDEKVTEFLKNKLFIEGLESVLFVMKEPSWTSKEGDERFWKARGVVREFLDKVYKISLAPLRMKRRVPIGLSKTQTKEFLYLFIKDAANLQELENLCLNENTRQEDRSREFFKLLESTYISEVIEEVRIRVKVRKIDGSLTFRELSEGEQQLLTVLGLLRFTRENESLFLLDEPDTHLNPAWSMEYMKFLQDVAGLDEYVHQQENSHIVLATHDPLVLASLTKEQIQIMKRDEDSMKVYSELPLYDPKGLGFSGILTSDMFGLRSDLDQETLGYLDEHAQLLSVDEPNQQQQNRIKELQNILGDAGFLQAYSDPYFSAFVKAWARKHRIAEFKKPFLSDNERHELETMTDEILEELEAEEKSTK